MATQFLVTLRRLFGLEFTGDVCSHPSIYDEDDRFLDLDVSNPIELCLDSVDFPKKSLRLVLISDTHKNHWDLVVPDGDILLHAGGYL